MNPLSQTLQKTDAAMQQFGAVRLAVGALALNGMKPVAANSGPGSELPEAALAARPTDGFSVARTYRFLQAALPVAKPGRVIFADERCFNAAMLPPGFSELTQLDMLFAGPGHDLTTAKQALERVLDGVYGQRPEFQILPRKTAFLGPGAVGRFRKRPAAPGGHPDVRTKNFLTFALMGVVRPEFVEANLHDPGVTQVVLLSFTLDLLAMDKHRVKTQASLYGR